MCFVEFFIISYAICQIYLYVYVLCIFYIVNKIKENFLFGACVVMAVTKIWSLPWNTGVLVSKPSGPFTWASR